MHVGVAVEGGLVLVWGVNRGNSRVCMTSDRLKIRQKTEQCLKATINMK